MKDEEGHKLRISESDAAEIENAYDGLLESLKELAGRKDINLVKQALYELVDFIIERLSLAEESLLLYTSKIFNKDYIFAHSLNVCLIGMRIGMRLNFAKARLKDLGFICLIHAGKDMNFAEGLDQGTRPDKDMEDIFKLADVYDALTHPPVYRHTMMPDETLKTIVETDKYFDKRIIKILLEELSLYPRGIWVQLSTKEIGRVVKINKGMLLRPIVKIFVDWRGRPLDEAKTVDLSQKSMIYIARPLTDEEAKKIIKE
jgi:HD-GYP domain-containing protein (c-di-GMP phosphodiesterase class II)